MRVLLSSRTPKMMRMLITTLERPIPMLLELYKGRFGGDICGSRVCRVRDVMWGLGATEMVVLVVDVVLVGEGRLGGRRAPPVRRLGRPEWICETQGAGFVAGGLNSSNFEGLSCAFVL